MPTSDEFRTKARRAIEGAKAATDPETKRRLAAQALAFAQAGERKALEEDRDGVLRSVQAERGSPMTILAATLKVRIDQTYAKASAAATRAEIALQNAAEIAAATQEVLARARARRRKPAGSGAIPEAKDIVSANAARYRSLLATEQDCAKRQQIERLLAEAEAELAGRAGD